MIPIGQFIFKRPLNRPSVPKVKRELPSHYSLSGRVIQSDPCPSPSGNYKEWSVWLNKQVPLRASAPESSSSSEAPPPESSSSSEAPPPESSSSSAALPAAAAISSKNTHARVEDDSEVVAKPKKRRQTIRQFPDISRFHEYVDIFYPINSNISYLNSDNIRVVGKIKSILKNSSGLPPEFIIQGREGNIQLNFDAVDVSVLKKNVNVMVFKEGDTPGHVYAKITQIIFRGAKRIYKMERHNVRKNRFFEIDAYNQMYKIIPVSIYNVDNVFSKLKEVWRNR